jgi:poly [ADP-ribose] polymerase 2/3/4
MSKIIASQKFVKTDAEANNNKVWQYDVYDDGTIHYQWGRIGASLQEQRKAFKQSDLDKKIAEKTQPFNGTKGGYREIVVMAPSGPSGPAVAGGPTGSTHIKAAALRDIAGSDTVLADLVKRLAEANKHEIQVASGGQMDIDLSTGVISTPVGVITKTNVDQARIILTNDLQGYVKKQDFDNSKFKSLLSDYLMLVPQRVGHRQWHKTFMTDDAALLRQASLLDQLEGSIELVEQRIAASNAAPVAAGVPPARAFDVRLELMKQDDPEFKSIVKFYEGGKNVNHTSHKLSPKRAFRVTLPHMKDAFQADGAKLPNIQRLWHGSRIFNLLSIMKRGFVLPKQLSSAAITGAMFGSGLYFSDQSTKSLNYSYGYWDGGSRDNNCFMFVVDVAMGKAHTPSGPKNFAGPPAGYDSIFANKSSGVMNNEMIVFRTGQANITHLVEFN